MILLVQLGFELYILNTYYIETAHIDYSSQRIQLLNIIHYVHPFKLTSIIYSLLLFVGGENIDPLIHRFRLNSGIGHHINLIGASFTLLAYDVNLWWRGIVFAGRRGIAQ